MKLYGNHNTWPGTVPQFNLPKGTLMSDSVFAKKFKLWNGHCRRDSVFVAAHSVAEACQLLSEVIEPISWKYFKSHWCESWGSLMQAAIGLPTEPCIWLRRYGEQVIKRLYRPRK